MTITNVDVFYTNCNAYMTAVSVEFAALLQMCNRYWTMKYVKFGPLYVFCRGHNFSTLMGRQSIACNYFGRRTP